MRIVVPVGRFHPYDELVFAITVHICHRRVSRIIVVFLSCGSPPVFRRSYRDAYISCRGIVSQSEPPGTLFRFFPFDDGSDFVCGRPIAGRGIYEIGQVCRSCAYSFPVLVDVESDVRTVIGQISPCYCSPGFICPDRSYTTSEGLHLHGGHVIRWLCDAFDRIAGNHSKKQTYDFFHVCSKIFLKYNELYYRQFYLEHLKYESYRKLYDCHY